MQSHLKLLLPGALALSMLAGCKGGGGANPKTDDDKTAYMIGFMAGHNTTMFKLTPDQAALAQQGFADAALGKPSQAEEAVYQPKVRQMAQAKQAEAQKAAAVEAAAKAQPQKDKDKPFLEAAAAEKGAEKTASGLVFKSTLEGKGDQPKASDYVKVNYTGKLSDGTVFDASEKHGGPTAFFLNRVVPCWTEGVQKIKVGGKATLTCPSDIAYGDRGNGTIPGGATLQFDVELVSIEPPPATPSMPGISMLPGAHGQMIPPGGMHPMPVVTAKPK